MLFVLSNACTIRVFPGFTSNSGDFVPGFFQSAKHRAEHKQHAVRGAQGNLSVWFA